MLPQPPLPAACLLPSLLHNLLLTLLENFRIYPVFGSLYDTFCRIKNKLYDIFLKISRKYSKYILTKSNFLDNIKLQTNGACANGIYYGFAVVRIRMVGVKSPICEGGRVVVWVVSHFYVPLSGKEFLWNYTYQMVGI